MTGQVATALPLVQGWRDIATDVEQDGSATHRWRLALGQPDAKPSDLADAVHTLCMLHGRHPGLIDHAATRHGPITANGWLADLADAFAHERTSIALLTAAVGPLPSTPGQAECEATIAAQRHALDMLAQSERAGCAIGAAQALTLDWDPIRALLDTIAKRFGATIPASEIDAAADTPPTLTEDIHPRAFDRALGFGAQQLLAQHRGFWDLLEARADARTRG